MINHRTQVMLNRSRAKLYFNEQRKLLLKQYEGSTSMDLYISSHFLDRVAERRLVEDMGYMVNMLNYFMRTIFYGTTQCNKSYTLKVHNLRVGVAIVDNHYVTLHRAIIVKTVFDKDVDEKGWYSDETIELRAVKTNTGFDYQEQV